MRRRNTANTIMSYPLSLSGRRGLMRLTIEHFIMDRFGFERRKDLLSNARYKWAVLARHSYLYMLHSQLKLPSTTIGEIVGMDHTSVLAGIKRIQESGAGVELERQFFFYIPPSYLWTRSVLPTQVSHIPRG